LASARTGWKPLPARCGRRACMRASARPMKRALTILRGLLGAGGARGLEVTIFNPRLDAGGSLAQHLSGLITNAVPGEWNTASR
jgi:hypothetical protein